MKWLSRFVVICFCFVAQSLEAQQWRPPVDHEIKLSGTFGELRTNHFHHGLDIKPKKHGKSGDVIRSIGDGYVSRISVQSGGYGHALYITHPEGYVSVYAHLRRFPSQIAKWIRNAQMNQKSWQIDTANLPAGLFPVFKGDKIGEMGSSGYSFGPHLHFEIRDSETEMTLNPLQFDFSIKDKTRPEINGISFYEIDFLGNIVDAIYEDEIKSQEVIRLKGRRFGIGVFTFDKMDNLYNKNGIYSLELKVDGQSRFYFVSDSVTFQESKVCNEFRDFARFEDTKETWYKMFLPSGANMNHGLVDQDEPLLDFSFKSEYQVNMIICDFNQNCHSKKFTVRGDGVEEIKSKSYQKILPFHEETNWSFDEWTLSCPKGAFYQPQYVDFVGRDTLNQCGFTHGFRLEGNSVPFYKPCVLKTKKHLGDKTVLLQCKKDKVVSYGGTVTDDYFEVPIFQWGSYQLYKDTIAPTIKLKRFPSKITKSNNRVSWQVEDDLDEKGRSHDIRYKAAINGSFVPVGYDVRTDELYYEIEDIPGGENLFELVIWDHVGNTTRWSKKFTFVKN